MEQYLAQQISVCAAQIDRYANRRDRRSREQWWYWMGKLRAYEALLELT